MRYLIGSTYETSVLPWCSKMTIVWKCIPWAFVCMDHRCLKLACVGAAVINKEFILIVEPQTKFGWTLSNHPSKFSSILSSAANRGLLHISQLCQCHLFEVNNLVIPLSNTVHASLVQNKHMDNSKFTSPRGWGRLKRVITHLTTIRILGQLFWINGTLNLLSNRWIREKIIYLED